MIHLYTTFSCAVVTGRSGVQPRPQQPKPAVMGFDLSEYSCT